MDTYYSSCWVRIQLRFEDYQRIPLAQAVTVPELPTGDPVSNAGFYELDLQVIPYTCKITLNSYRQADECELSIPYTLCPLDPRVIRQATIQVYAGQVTAQEFAATQGTTPGGPIRVVGETNLRGEPTEVFRGFIDSWELSLDGEDRISISARDITAILLDAEMPVGGLAGIPRNMELDQVIRSVVVGEGSATGALPDERQQRAARVDARKAAKRLRAKAAAVEKKLARAQAAQPPDPDLVSDLELELDLLRTDYAEAAALARQGDSLPVIAARYGLPGMRGLVVVNETGAPLPELAKLKGADWFDSAQKAKKAKAGAGKKKISYWDFITDICVGCGYICYFRTPRPDSVPPGQPLPPAELVITEPRTYYTQAGGELRTFVYGYNVDTITVERDYTGRNVPDGVIVTAVEDSTGAHISVRYPGGERIVTRSGGSSVPGTAGPGDRVEFQSIILRDRIPGPDAGATLTRIARSLYEQWGRGEFKLQISTTALGAYPSNWGTGVDDMFGLRAGDSIVVQLAQAQPDTKDAPYTTVGAYQRLGPAERVRYLTEVTGLSQAAAQMVVRAESSEDFQLVYRVAEVSIDWDHSTGFSFEIDAINYLDARAAVERSQAAEESALQLVRTYRRSGPPVPP